LPYEPVFLRYNQKEVGLWNRDFLAAVRMGGFAFINSRLSIGKSGALQVSASDPHAMPTRTIYIDRLSSDLEAK